MNITPHVCSSFLFCLTCGCPYNKHYAEGYFNGYYDGIVETTIKSIKSISATDNIICGICKTKTHELSTKKIGKK